MKLTALLALALLTACSSTSDTAQPRSAAELAAPAAEFVQPQPAAARWKPAASRMTTRWGREVTPETAWREYPRPTLVRERWSNLNGLWDYAIVTGRFAPSEWEGQILVPFGVESALSGVGRRVGPEQCVWYRRSFELPVEWQSERLLLHFGAVDWHARVLVNGREAGVHAGGYDPFTFEVSDLVHTGVNELVVVATDPTDAAGQPRGKQVSKPAGIWYTPTTGIWQTVWLEPVPRTFVRGLVIRADSRGDVVVGVDAAGAVDEAQVEIHVLSARRSTEAHFVGPVGAHRLHVEHPRLWSPDDPYLYGVLVRLLGSSGDLLDEVTSYCGFRDITLAADSDGVQRLMLNGQPLFQFGPLDQGFWPDGLYTAPSVEALRFDIEAVKRMGGNMLRKHVKVEPELFYALCDRLGVLVWQDMPSGDFDQADWRAPFEAELRELVRDRGHHPSIVMWVPFNEGWGQHDTERVTALVKELDPTRLVNNASGWTDKGVGDVMDVHAYPGPAMAQRELVRAVVLGEFGGLGLPLEGHTWLDKDNWGYRSYATQAELSAAYVELLRRLPLLIGEGLCAAVYTQTTDVEIEVNGWLTYDREVWKIDPAQAAAAARKLYEPPPKLVPLVAHAGNGGSAEWRYTFEAPPAGWEQPGCDVSAWSRGRSGFGTAGTPGAFVGTEWKGPEIWLRREFDLDAARLSDPQLWIHHDEDVRVYLNGVLAAELSGYTTGYVLEPISAAARAALRPGRNVLALHCRQTSGGQYIDAGLADVR